jgi:hypothetical protein
VLDSLIQWATLLVQTYDWMVELTIQANAVLRALAYHQALDNLPVCSHELYEPHKKICDHLHSEIVRDEPHKLKCSPLS